MCTTKEVSTSLVLLSLLFCIVQLQMHCYRELYSRHELTVMPSSTMCKVSVTASDEQFTCIVIVTITWNLHINSLVYSFYYIL